MQEVSSNEIFGIARKISNELDGLPIVAHGVIVEMIKNAFEYRHLKEKKAFQDQQMANQHRALELQGEQIKAAREARDRHEAEKLQPHLVDAGAPN